MRWLLVVATGCGFGGPRLQTADARLVDGREIDAVDAEVMLVDAPPGDTCLGPAGGFRICIPTPKMQVSYNVAANGIDTGASGCILVPQPIGNDLCVIAGTTITIGPLGPLYAYGNRPLVLFATDAITILGDIDVGSHFRGQASGAGADPLECHNPSMAGGGNNGGGGGGGGTFATKGSNGGHGGDSNGQAGNASSMVVAKPDHLRGGCSGGRGGDGDSGSAPGNGNDGGGALLLLAGGHIQIGGTIDASGAGAAGGTPPKAGGGGGGSGGMIAMFAASITVTGQLDANGGGGGGGGSNNQTGGIGNDSPGPGTVATGGAASSGATDGGDGAISTALPTNGATAGQGAGGGGGGLGVIRVLSGQTIGGTSSPTPTN